MNPNELAPWKPKRDRYDRPLIVPVGGGEPVGYTRPSTIAKTLDSEYALGAWAERKVAAGLVLRPDLLALIASHLTPTGDIPPEHKKQIQQWCKEAKQAARDAEGANLGTALHKFTETLDGGGQVFNVPEALQGDIEAYREIMAGIGIVAIEQFVVNDEWHYAGTFDRILRYQDQLVIGDLKTTQNIDFSHNANAVQLACYAHGTPYHDGVRGMSLLDQGVRQDFGIVIWLPAGAGRAELYTVDLTAGWEAFKLSMATRAWRDREPAERIRVTAPKAQTQTTIAQTHALLDALERNGLSGEILCDPAALRWVKRRIALLPADAKAALANAWPPNVAGFRGEHDHSADELEAIIGVLDRIEAAYGIPFGETDPRLVKVAPTPETPTLGRPWVNETSDFASAEMARSAKSALRLDFDARPAGVRTVIEHWLAQAEEAGCGFGLGVMSQRRIAILNTCYALIEHLERDDFILAAISHVSGPVAQGRPIGVELGQLTKDQATALGELARGVGRGDVTMTVGDDGRVTYTPATKQKETTP